MKICQGNNKINNNINNININNNTLIILILTVILTININICHVDWSSLMKFVINWC